MREQMPVAAMLVDALRLALGKEAADALLKRSRAGLVSRGQGAFYCAEIGPDGLLREFGTALDGWHGEVVDGRVVRIGGKACN